MINNFIIKSKVWLYAGPPAGGGRWHFLTVPKSPFGNSPTMSLFFEFQDLRTAAFRTGGAGSLKAALANFFVIFLRFLSSYQEYASKNPRKMPRTWLNA